MYVLQLNHLKTNMETARIILKINDIVLSMDIKKIKNMLLSKEDNITRSLKIIVLKIKQEILHCFYVKLLLLFVSDKSSIRSRSLDLTYLTI